MTLGERVSAAFDAAGVPHALIGAAALAAAGIVRSTLDLDLLTLDHRVLDQIFWGPLRDAGAGIEVRRGDVDDPLAGVVRASMPNERPVDVIVGRHAWQQRAIDRAQVLPSSARVVQPRDLVLLKLHAGGAQDLWDIGQLLAAAEGPDLASQVDEDLPDLPAPAAALWAGVRGSH